MLNLGLELEPEIIRNVDLTDLLQAELDSIHAEQELIDYFNICEIVYKAKKYSSQECIEYANDLLGSSVEDIQISLEDFSDKIKNAWNKIWEFVKKFWDFLKAKIKEFLAKLTSSKEKIIPFGLSLTKENMKKAHQYSNEMSYNANSANGIDAVGKQITDFKNKFKTLFTRVNIAKEFTSAKDVRHYCQISKRVYNSIYDVGMVINKFFTNLDNKQSEYGVRLSKLKTVQTQFYALNREIVKWIKRDLQKIYQHVLFTSSIRDSKLEAMDSAQDASSYVDAKNADLRSVDFKISKA